MVLQSHAASLVSIQSYIILKNENWKRSVSCSTFFSQKGSISPGNTGLIKKNAEAYLESYQIFMMKRFYKNS